MATAEPARLTTSEFRKIELQSPADLQHLIGTARRAARTKIDAAFPPSAAPKDGGVDHVRRRVEELVDEYIRSTFDGVRRGVCVNGVDLSEEVHVRGGGKQDGGEGVKGVCDCARRENLPFRWDTC
jgi:kinetochor protein Mis14/NSL1